MNKKSLSKLMVLVLAFLLAFSLFTGCVSPTPEPTPPPPLPEEEDLGEPIIKDLDAYKNPYGYASLTITNRRSTPESKIAEVATEIEFLDALLDRSKTVIKITEGLDMGYNYVVNKLEEAGKTPEEIAKYANETRYNLASVYRQNPALPDVHPDLIESGIGQLLIQDRSELMIYSETGITIKHLTIWIRGTNAKPVNNIVIRNLHLTDIWEWDEMSMGQYDQNDWDFFTIERASDIWIDHITFGNSYDGTVDVKLNCKNITLSWLDMDFPITETVRRQKAYLDENIENYPYYKQVKELFESMSEDDFLTYLSSQKKGFNLGNTTDGPGFEQMTVTIHHVNAYNLQDRLPRLRKGDAHVYNVLSDNTDIANVRKRTGQNITSQAIVSTEDGAVLMENSRLVSIAEPIKTHQDSNTAAKYSGKFKVVNSQLVSNGVLHTASTPSSIWSSLSANATFKEFYLRNYQYIPYYYELDDPNDLKNIFANNHVGAGVIEDLDWKEIRISLGNLDPAPEDGHKINPDITIPQANVEKGTAFNAYEPVVYNFYKPTASSTYAEFVEGEDYTLTIDDSSIPVDSEGKTTTTGLYYVRYNFTSKKFPDEQCMVMQTVVVFDENGFSVPLRATTEFNKTVDLLYQANMASGKLYYLLTDDVLDLATSQDFIKTNGTGVTITTTEPTSVSKIETNDKKYAYAYIEDESTRSTIQRVELKLELELEISSEEDFVRATTQSNLSGVYYKLTKDLDFAGKNNLFTRLQSEEDNSYLNFDSSDMVFDGQGFTIKNIDIEQTDPGLNPPPEWTDPRRGIFGRANNCVVKNVNFENGSLVSHKDANHTGFLFELTDNYLEVTNVSFKDLNVKNVKSGYVAAVVGLVNSGTVVLNNVSLVDAVITGTKNYNGGLIGGNKTMGINYEFKDLFLDNVKVNATTTTLQYSGLVVGRYMGQNSTMSLDGIAIYNSKIAATTNAGLVFAKLETGAKFVGTNMYFAGNEIVLAQKGSKAGGFVTGNYNTADDTTVGKFIATNVFALDDYIFRNGLDGIDFTYADKTKFTDGDEEQQEGLVTIEVGIVDSVDAAWFAANLSELSSARGWAYADGKLILVH